MTDIFLTNIDNIKNLTALSDNTNGKVLQLALREAQEIDLQEIIGTCLLEKLKELIVDGEVSLPENAIYKNLLNIIQYFLSYDVVSKVAVPLAIKFDNIGVVQATDTNINPLNIDDIYNVAEYYGKRADYYTGRIQAYLRKHRDELEVCCGDCSDIKAVLDSSANTSLWLGGYRGYGYQKNHHYNYDIA